MAPPTAGASDGSVEEGREGLWEGEKVKGKCLLVGDSLVRHADRGFGCGYKQKRMCVCLPGARVEDISQMVNRVVGDEEVVVVQIGTNNLRRDCQSVLRSRFRELICRLKSTRAKIAICGILPRFDGRVAGSTIRGHNRWLELECEGEGVQFVDLSSFWGKRDLYKNDGLHLHKEGPTVLGRLISSGVKGFLN